MKGLEINADTLNNNLRGSMSLKNILGEIAKLYYKVDSFDWSGIPAETKRHYSVDMSALKGQQKASFIYAKIGAAYSSFKEWYAENYVPLIVCSTAEIDVKQLKQKLPETGSLQVALKVIAKLHYGWERFNWDGTTHLEVLSWHAYAEFRNDIKSLLSERLKASIIYGMLNKVYPEFKEIYEKNIVPIIVPSTTRINVHQLKQRLTETGALYDVLLTIAELHYAKDKIFDWSDLKYPTLGDYAGFLAVIEPSPEQPIVVSASKIYEELGKKYNEFNVWYMKNKH